MLFGVIKVWLHVVNYNLENRMINSSVIPTISQTIRVLNQPVLVKPNEVVAAITPTKSVAAVSTNVSVNIKAPDPALSQFSLNSNGSASI